MPEFEFTSPEGKIYSISGPEGSTKEQAFSILQQQLKGKSIETPKEDIFSQIKAATIDSPTAVGTREALTHPVESLAKFGEGVKELFSPEWQKKYQEKHGKGLSKEEQQKLYDVAINWMPITETVGSFQRMKAMMASEKEAPKTTSPTTADDIVKAHSNVNRMMKEDGSGSLIVDTQKFINESQGIKTAAQKEKDIKAKRAEVKAAFNTDKDYADYLRYTADERIQLREQWAKEETTRAEAAITARQEKIKQSLEESAKRAETPLAREQVVDQQKKAWESYQREIRLQRMGLSLDKEPLGGVGKKGFGQGGAWLPDSLFKEKESNSSVNRFKTPIRLSDGSRISGTNDVNHTVLVGYDKNGELFTQRVSSFNPELIIKEDRTARTAQYLSGIINKQSGGFAQQQLVQRLAGASVGGITGAYLDPDHPISAAAVGTIVGLGGVRVAESIPKALEATKGAFKGLADTRYRIDDLTNAHDYHIKQAARATMQATSTVRELVKDEAARTKLSHWLEGDRSIRLNADEMKAAQIVRQFFNGIDNEATKIGVYDQGRENYVTHIWDFQGKGKSATLDALFGEKGTGGSKRFAKERTIPTLKEGIAQGLTPKTTDIADIMDIYSQSMFRAIENKKLVDSLKNAVIPATSERLLLPISNKIPVGYKMLNGLPGYAVHPDIEGPLKVLFENYQPNVITRTMLGLNMATKRLGVSYSLFHAKALTDAYIGAMGVSPRAYSELAKMRTGSSEMLKQLKSGGAGDLVDQALKGGLEISHPTVDIDPQLLHLMVDDAGKLIDKILPFGIGEKAGKGLKAVDKKLDTFMWERLHTGMKLEVFAKEYENAILKNAEAHAKDSSIPLLDKTKVAQDVASYTNDLFGGLNWNRIFNEAQTKIGRNVMMAMSSPSGKVGAQLLMFAPDWTLSTTRAAYKGLHPNNEMLTKLHRRYMIRSALYYFTAAEALNQALSGHSVLENKDPTRIDFGDGRTMQFSKHAMEPIHWATDTTKQAFNKLGFVPKELIEQKEMIQPTIEKRIAHVAKKLLPISAQTSFDKEMSLQTFGEAGLSFLGMPVYGKTEEQKKESDREKRKRRRRKEEE